VSDGWAIDAAVVVAAYLLGTLPSALFVARRRGHDPTVEGSLNPGASNVYRLAGRAAGAIVLMVDVSKGLAATLAGLAAGGRTLALAAGIAAVLGHIAPVTRRFRGGKGVATAGGMALVLWPVASAALAIAFLVVVATVRIASVGSLVVAAGLPLAVALIERPVEEIVGAGLVAVLVIARHHGNIGRLITGEERAIAPVHSDPDPDRPAKPSP
jgi:acyl phosphate:glycerol-3-phosphate acyltransferase